MDGLAPEPVWMVMEKSGTSCFCKDSKPGQYNPQLIQYTVRTESCCALIKGVGSLEVMFTSVYTGLNLFNFIRKHFLQICL